MHDRVTTLDVIAAMSNCKERVAHRAVPADARLGCAVVCVVGRKRVCGPAFLAHHALVKLLVGILGRKGVLAEGGTGWDGVADVVRTARTCSAGRGKDVGDAGGWCGHLEVVLSREKAKCLVEKIRVLAHQDSSQTKELVMQVKLLTV